MDGFTEKRHVWTVKHHCKEVWRSGETWYAKGGWSEIAYDAVTKSQHVTITKGVAQSVFVDQMVPWVNSFEANVMYILQ